jgi:hypothetical protein
MASIIQWLLDSGSLFSSVAVCAQSAPSTSVALYENIRVLMAPQKS